MKIPTLPGIVVSAGWAVITALVGWGITYFAPDAPGGALALAPVISSALVAVMQIISVKSAPPEPAAQSRGTGDGTASRSDMSKILWG